MPGQRTRRGTYAEENAFALTLKMRWPQFAHDQIQAERRTWLRPRSRVAE